MKRISIPLSDISFGSEEEAALLGVLRSGWISMGPETERFEAEFASCLGAGHAVAVSSGTAALHLALHSLGLGPGDEVVMPSLTFVACANVVRHLGAVPVFADITGEIDWNISPEEIEHRVTSRTRAVVVVHYGGFPCRMDEIVCLARRLGLVVVEDAAHGPGGSYKGKRLGTWGDAGCFSFFANKNMTTGEGGMVVTDDWEIARRVRSLRCHGMTAGTWERRVCRSFSYDVDDVGYNYRIDELRAALGRIQLRRLERHNAARRRITGRLRDALHEVPGLSVPFSHVSLDSSACHIFPVLLDSPDARPGFMEDMASRGIQTSIHYPPIHEFSAYRDICGKTLPVTESVAPREVTLPLFPSMTDAQIQRVAEAAKDSLEMS